MNDRELVVFAIAIGLGVYLAANIIGSWIREIKYQRDHKAWEAQWGDFLEERG